MLAWTRTQELSASQTYPIAFLEFYEDENGEKQREGPRNEQDERAADEKWKVGSASAAKS